MGAQRMHQDVAWDRMLQLRGEAGEAWFVALERRRLRDDLVEVYKIIGKVQARHMPIAAAS